jgi:hypothetical protein
MPVSLSPAVAPTIKSKSKRYTCMMLQARNIRQLPHFVNVSVPAKSRQGAAGYFPNERRLISARPPQSSAGLN